jgi:nitrate/nitrite transporter NarK
MSDKLGGARVTFWNFVLMGVAVLGVMVSCRPMGRVGTSGAS